MKSFRTIFWLTVFSILAISLFAQAQNPKLVKDINPGSNGSGEYWNATMNGIFYFSADDGTNGKELWRSDGTLAGTYMVKDVSGRGLNPRYLANCNGTLYFSGDDGVTGMEPWKSDGTANGTVLLKDMVPAGTSGGSSSPTSFVYVNGKTYFSANTAMKRGGSGAGGAWYTGVATLCVTNGTTGGTMMISSTNALVPVCMIGYNNLLYCYGTTWPNSSWWVRKGCQTEVYKSNGTVKGTVIMKDINPGNEASCYSGIYTNYPLDRMVTTNGYLYFRADDGSNGSELWRSDGSSGGTIAETDLYAGIGGATPTWMTVMGNAIYFVAVNGADGDKLWKYDVTSRQTTLVKDFNTSADSSYILWLTAVDNKLFFSAKDPESGQELWVSDGTTQGTVLIDINAGTGSSNPNYVYTKRMSGWEAPSLHNGVPNFAVIGSYIYFAADDGSHGVELWRSDGTTTELVKDINVGTSGSSPRYLTVVNGKLFFRAFTPETGDELWIFDPALPIAKSIIRTAQKTIPNDLELGQNYPNPFGGAALAGNPTTTIRYAIPADVHVTLKVYDMYAREIATLVDVAQKAGMYTVPFDAKDLTSGTYMYRIEAAGKTMTRIMTLLK